MPPNSSQPTKVLMLTPNMRMGYGIPEALAALDRYLEPLGVETEVGCLDHDNHFWWLRLHRVRPDAESVRDLAARIGASCVIAHGSPFFEVLPALTGPVRTIAYEYGDPTPELFADDGPERRAIADFKKTQVYPLVDAVAAISAFIAHDIGWPDAEVIPLGIEHVSDLGPKLPIPPGDPSAPLRVGTLMRLGTGEAHYKGNHLLLRLQEQVAAQRPSVRFELMGRGTKDDATPFLDAGFAVHLNATTDERTRFLREIDVFVSPSQWEGCNLPLVEAQALGTPALAFDTGAHPEFTPLVFPTLAGMVQQILAYDSSRSLVMAHGRDGYRFIRNEMSWENSATLLADLIRDGAAIVPRRRPIGVRARTQIRRVRSGVRQRGVAGATRQAASKFRGRL